MFICPLQRIIHQRSNAKTHSQLNKNNNNNNNQFTGYSRANAQQINICIRVYVCQWCVVDQQIIFIADSRDTERGRERCTNSIRRASLLFIKTNWCWQIQCALCALCNRTVQRWSRNWSGNLIYTFFGWIYDWRTSLWKTGTHHYILNCANREIE